MSEAARISIYLVIEGSELPVNYLLLTMAPLNRYELLKCLTATNTMIFVVKVMYKNSLIYRIFRFKT